MSTQNEIVAAAIPRNRNRHRKLKFNDDDLVGTNKEKAYWLHSKLGSLEELIINRLSPEVMNLFSDPLAQWKTFNTVQEFMIFYYDDYEEDIVALNLPPFTLPKMPNVLTIIANCNTRISKNASFPKCTNFSVREISMFPDLPVVTHIFAILSDDFDFSTIPRHFIELVDSFAPSDYDNARNAFAMHKFEEGTDAVTFSQVIAAGRHGFENYQDYVNSELRDVYDELNEVGLHNVATTIMRGEQDQPDGKIRYQDFGRDDNRSIADPIHNAIRTSRAFPIYGEDAENIVTAKARMVAPIVTKTARIYDPTTSHKMRRKVKHTSAHAKLVGGRRATNKRTTKTKRRKRR